MRILVAMPHFFRPKAEAGHGSERADAEGRAQTLRMALLALHQTLAPSQRHMASPQQACNGALTADLDVVICTTEGAHLLDKIPADLFRHHVTEASPRLLGYECHAVLADALGRYDFYCYMEDDLLLNDPLFFFKLEWFTKAAGERAILQPHRFELSPDPPVRKLYIDGPLVDRTISPRFQDATVRPSLRGSVLGREVGFERVDNPHSGCFFLTAPQMARWAEQPYFLDRADGFWGPLESAATLGLMRTFDVYKPVTANAGFLEIQHLDRRYLGTRTRFRPEAAGALG